MNPEVTDGTIEKPRAKPSERRQARHVYSKIQFPNAPSSVRSEIKRRKSDSPCRSYGAWIVLSAKLYRQVAPNGALNSKCFRAFAGFSTEPSLAFGRRGDLRRARAIQKSADL